MVWVPPGRFLMGSNDHYPEEAPAHRVSVDGFWIDTYAVTNAQFAAFVADTGHVTVAELPPDPAVYPDADPSLMQPASVVFTPPSRPVTLDDHLAWWSLVPGADWRHPRGPDSNLTGLSDHPVVHVAWADVIAYSAWAGKSLPTEAEWEYAARAGRRGTEYAWGDELTPDGVHMANVWQGEFPLRNLAADGYEWTAPVGSFPANEFGVFDLIGNVWEWTSRLVRHVRRLSARVLRSYQSGRRRGGQRGARQPDAAEGDQGRLVPLRTELLPPLPSRRADGAGDRHVNLPSRLPLRDSARSIRIAAPEPKLSVNPCICRIMDSTRGRAGRRMWSRRRPALANRTSW